MNTAGVAAPPTTPLSTGPRTPTFDEAGSGLVAGPAGAYIRAAGYRFSAMRVTMLLADSVQAAEGKLNVLGAGWTLTGPQPSPSGIGLIFDVPWDRTNEQIQFRLELLDQDGNPVIVPTPEGDQPLLIEGNFEVGRPPGIKRGTPITFPVAINLGPQPLEPGGRYEWRLTVNGESDEDWRLAFGVRAQPMTYPGMPGSLG